MSDIPRLVYYAYVELHIVHMYMDVAFINLCSHKAFEELSD